MAELARHNHYVAKTYLRRWADDRDMVSACRTLVSHPNVRMWTRRPVRGVAPVEHLYTSIEGNAETDAFEKRITREFEEPGLEAIEKIVSGQRLKPKDWERLAWYA